MKNGSRTKCIRSFNINDHSTSNEEIINEEDEPPNLGYGLKSISKMNYSQKTQSKATSRMDCSSFDKSPDLRQKEFWNESITWSSEESFLDNSYYSESIFDNSLNISSEYF